MRRGVRGGSVAAQRVVSERCGTIPPLSSSPDLYGRIHTLWEAEYVREASENRPNSFARVEVSQGQTHEAFVYFGDPEGRDSVSAESFTTLWYGPTLFEFPIMPIRTEPTAVY